MSELDAKLVSISLRYPEVAYNLFERHIRLHNTFVATSARHANITSNHRCTVGQAEFGEDAVYGIRAIVGYGYEASKLDSSRIGLEIEMVVLQSLGEPKDTLALGAEEAMIEATKLFYSFGYVLFGQHLLASWLPNCPKDLAQDCSTAILHKLIYFGDGNVPLIRRDILSVCV